MKSKLVPLHINNAIVFFVDVWYNLGVVLCGLKLYQHKYSFFEVGGRVKPYKAL